MTIADLVRSARRSRGLDQCALAALAGTSQPAISAYESGRQRPSTATLMRLLDACDFGLRLAPDPDGTSPATSLAGVVHQLVVNGDFDDEAFVVRWLLNQFARNDWNEFSPLQREAALLHEPPPTGSRRWDAFVAALAAFLARTSSIEVPAWTQNDKRTLAGLAWFPGRPGDGDIARRIVEADPAPEFVARGVGLDAASLPAVAA